MRHLILFCLLTSFVDSKCQDVFLEPPTRVKQIRLETLKSNSGQDYIIYINLPDGYEDSAKKYPVFYMLDPDMYFTGATNIYKKLIDQNKWDESIIIGIGYGNQVKAKRFRDYSPTFEKEYKESGNGEKFRQFIEDTLFPFIEDNFRVTDKRTIYGHSMGGLFACYVLFTKPTIFNNYIISSPSLWWNKGVIFTYEEKYYSVTKELAAKVYFSIADEKDISQDLRKLIDKLEIRAYKGLKIKIEDFPTNTHQTVVPYSLTNGLSFIFGTN